MHLLNISRMTEKKVTFTSINVKSLVRSLEPNPPKDIGYEFSGRRFVDHQTPYYARDKYWILGGDLVGIRRDAELWDDTNYWID